MVWLLLIVTLLTAYLIQRRRFRWMPPSSSAMLLGILAGAVSRVAGLEKPLRFRWASLPCSREHPDGLAAIRC